MFKTILLFAIAVTGANASCPSCSPGKTCESNTCIDCVAGKFREGTIRTTNPDNGCLDCPTGYHRPGPGGGSCTQCPIRKYQADVGQTACKNCAAGKYGDQVAQSSCTNCPQNKYGDLTGQASPTSCKACKLYLPFDSVAPTQFCLPFLLAVQRH